MAQKNQSLLERVITLSVTIEVDILKDGDYFVAYSPALDLSSYGKSEVKAQKAFEENFQIFVEETFKKGTLEKELLSLGWQLKQRPQPLYKPPTRRPKSQFDRVSTRTETLNIPIPAY